MSQLAQLKEQLIEAQTMQFITNAFTEVNSIKARNIRDGFEKNRRFYKEITDVYHSVKLTAAMLGRDKTPENKVGSSVSIAITSNMRFYGKLNANVMEKFVADHTPSAEGNNQLPITNFQSNQNNLNIKNLDIENSLKIENLKLKINKGIRPDLIVIGQTGLDFLESKNVGLDVEPLRFKRDFPQASEISFLIEKTKQYDRVFLYYPKFVNMVTQKVGILDITQAIDTKELAQAKKEVLDQNWQKGTLASEKIDIFEPEVEKILEFFERQVRVLLLIRTMLETELSRTAARLLSMSAARERAEFTITAKRTQYSKVKNSLENAKILETFAGMSNWNEFGK